jgi:NhaP-type Na+/H+ or K+/H+ antiporter
MAETTTGDSHTAAGGGGHGAQHSMALESFLLLFIFMIIGQLFKQLSAWSGVPFTTNITVIGVLLGYFADSFGKFAAPIQAWSEMDPHLLMMIFLPALIFESAFNSDWHIFKHELGKVLLMAGPMLILATFITAAMFSYVLGYSATISWSASLLFGSIVSATDPVAVVALLKELGASRRLATLIEGESLLNDGTAMVVFLVLLDICKGEEPSAGAIALRFIRLACGGVALGIAGGVIVSFLLSRIYNNYVLEVNTTVVSVYVIFYVAEASLGVSGILAIVALGLYMTNTGKTRISVESEHAVHFVWGYIGFTAETVIFILSGLIMGRRFADTEDSVIGGMDFLALLGCYVFLHLIRFGLCVLFWPCLSQAGYAVTFEQIVLISYAGLRGAVGLSLALIVTQSDDIPTEVQDIVLFHVGGIALLTLLINATTTGRLVRWLGLSKQTDYEKSILYSLADRLNKNVDDNIK